MSKDINKEKFLTLKLKDISCVYQEKQNWCRCGCGGEYYSTRYLKDPKDYCGQILDEKK